MYRRNRKPRPGAEELARLEIIRRALVADYFSVVDVDVGRRGVRGYRCPAQGVRLDGRNAVGVVAVYG